MTQVWRDETYGGECDGQPWVVVLVDPQTGDIESFGPYERDHAERLKMWCLAELDVDDLGDVVVMVAPMRLTAPGAAC